MEDNNETTTETVTTADVGDLNTVLGDEPTTAPVAGNRHPAHHRLDELEAKLHSLGSYALSVLKPMIDEVRNSLP